jgi:anaerobic magnesium-protoporphyrin IX monomethyl ester cyclase
MRIMLLNPAHPAIGSRIPKEHLPPLGLLAIGGALVDAGHEVKLVDGELMFGPMVAEAMAAEARAWGAEVVMVGHSGSTSGHPAACAVMRTVRRRVPGAKIVYGGVFPTYHWREVLEGEEEVDVVVRGEGERTVVRLVEALEAGEGRRTRAGAGWEWRLEEVEGIAYRKGGVAVATGAARVIEDLDACRVGWELVDLARYSYWGDKRAVVVQFSRGCPHRCSYCGQRGFWTKWRHRDPEKFAAEIAWLHREHGVEVFNFADENPTALRGPWKAFLEALIATGVKVTLVGSTRADDIVRDADILALYKKAGVARWLLGIENYDEATLKRIRKDGSPLKDRRAIELLRENGILAMATWVVGFEEERDGDYWRGLRQLLAYDPDQIQLLYATPHRWTGLFAAERGRRVIQLDQGKWDYKHQVLATRHVPAWRVMLWVKSIEAVMQMRPKALGRLWLRDGGLRAAQRWYYRIGRKVWFHEVWEFLFGDRRVARGPTLAEYWQGPVGDEEAMVRVEVKAVARRGAPLGATGQEIMACKGG